MLQEPFSPALGAAMEFGRRRGRAELDTVFAPELEEVAPAERSRLRAALEVALSNSTWDTLTGSPDVSTADVGALMGQLARAALAAWGLAVGAAAPSGPGDRTTEERPPQTSAGPG
jgi:hypothetical protein